MVQTSTQRDIPPSTARKNPSNPRRYFNESALDLLKTSIQEVGIMVPLIVYADPEAPSRFVLMDGERRWQAALELNLDSIPVNVVARPTPLENLLRMFNIHAVREEWPLISIALSLQDVMELSHEVGEKRLSEMTGLTRSTVRRAKRLLSLPSSELELIKSEAHLDRDDQIHREDLYLEIEQAENVLRQQLPELTEEYPRERVIRSFVAKREAGVLRAVTDFRDVSKLVKTAEEGLVERETVVLAARRLLDDVNTTPTQVFNDIARGAYEMQTLARKCELLTEELSRFEQQSLSATLRQTLSALRTEVDRLLALGDER